MSSNYQMYLKLGEGDIFRFPVLPEKITVSYGNNNDNIRVCGVGEVTIIQDSDAAVIQFSSFFPKTYFNGCEYSDIPDPNNAVSMVNAMRTNKKPARFTLAGGMGVSMYCSIEKFEIYEQGGDPGTIYYSMQLKEYREVIVRQIQVNVSSKKASISTTASRTDNSTPNSTYTVVRGDCLWNIAKKFYGNGNKFTNIYEANKSIIGSNPNKIYPGQVLSIPAA